MSNDMIAKFVSESMAEGTLDLSQAPTATPIAATISPRERAELSGLLERLAVYAAVYYELAEDKPSETAAKDQSSALHWSARLAVKTGKLEGLG